MRLTTILALAAIFGATALPMAASAQSRSGNRSDSDRRDNDRRHSGSQDRRNNNDRSDWNRNRNNNRHDRDKDRRDRDRRDHDRRDNNWRDRDRRDNDWGDRDRRDNDWRRNESDRRQDTKNEWRNIAIGAGALSLLGLLQGDNTLFFGGAAGSLYSLHRYEQDRKSQSALDRARSHYFNRDHFYRDGIRFDRKLVNKNGQRYYQFTRCR